MASHSLERTSPKGTRFVGTCVLCGQEGLTIADMNDECPNQRGLTQDEALLEAIEGVKPRNSPATEQKLREAIQEACDLLAERTHASPARSAGHNARLRLEATLALPSAQDGWRGIESESAPKDGTLIDLWAAERDRYESHRIPHCYWYEGEWVHERTIHDDEPAAGENTMDVAALFHITHWRPLPPPPLPSEQGKE